LRAISVDGKAEVAASKHTLDDARGRLRTLENAKASATAAVNVAEDRLRGEKQNSQLHKLYATMWGVPIEQVTDSNLSILMKLLVGLPAGLASIISSGIILVSVTRLKKKAAIPRPDEATLTILKAASKKITESATAKVAEDFAAGLREAKADVESKAKNNAFRATFDELFAPKKAPAARRANPKNAKPKGNGSDVPPEAQAPEPAPKPENPRTH